MSKRRALMAAAAVLALAVLGRLWRMRERALEPASTARLEASIERGLAYLRGQRADPSALIVLDYLRRKYGLAADLAFERTFGDRRDARDLGAWGRFVGLRTAAQLHDDSLSLEPWPNEPSVEAMVVHALYCDVVPPPSSFATALERFAAKGSYELTHAVLADKLVRDNGCSVDRLALDAAQDHFRARLLRFIMTPPSEARFAGLDVRYEALAVLEDLLRTKAPREAIEGVLVEQQADGGWRPAPDQPSGPHPTVLAVWSLLARLHPNAPPTTFARR
jgi:hypothetical protein